MKERKSDGQRKKERKVRKIGTFKLKGRHKETNEESEREGIK